MTVIKHIVSIVEIPGFDILPSYALSLYAKTEHKEKLRATRLARNKANTVAVKARKLL